MKQRPWGRWIVTAVVLLAAGGAVSGQELRLPQGRWWENPRLVRQLGLTGEQRERIRSLVYEHAQRMIDLNAEVRHAGLELERRVSDDLEDLEAVREAFARFQQARRALERERFELLLAVRQVLTREQWDRLRRMRAERQRLRGRRPGRRPPGARRPLPPPGAPHPPP